MANRSKLLTGLIMVIMLTACSGSGSKTPSSHSIKFDQYYIQGEQLYTAHCGNCHQAGGQGLGQVYPPLAKSDYIQEHFEDVLCMMRHGKEGELMVNGASYVQGMPGNTTLTDIEIAEIATYIYNTWGHDRGLVEVKEASPILAACAR